MCNENVILPSPGSHHIEIPFISLFLTLSPPHTNQCFHFSDALNVTDGVSVHFSPMARGEGNHKKCHVSQNSTPRRQLLGRGMYEEKTNVAGTSLYSPVVASHARLGLGLLCKTRYSP